MKRSRPAGRSVRAMLRGRVNQWRGLCSAVPVAPRGRDASGAAVHGHARDAYRTARRVSHGCVVSVVRVVAGRFETAGSGVMTGEDRVAAGNGCAGIGIAHCTGARIAARACRTDTVRHAAPMNCTHRHSIATAPFRHDFDQPMCVAAICGMHATADAGARNRSLEHPSRAPIRRHRSSTDVRPQTNDRFKRRAGYLGTAVSSITRSGRRPCPGQYALPYIRWTGPNCASLAGDGAAKPFSITA